MLPSKNGKVVDFQSYKNKRDLDTGEITLDELSLEELDAVENLYAKEIQQLIKDIEKTKANIERLEAENERLRRVLADAKKEND